MKQEMTYKKSTKNTYVFVAEGTEIPTLYVQKSAFPDISPSKIVITVEVVE